MRKIMAVALTTGLLAGCSTRMSPVAAPMQAQTPTVSSQSATGLKQALKHAINSIFQNADFNRDGVLAPNEGHGLDSTAFAQADKNKDYKLTVSEFLKYYNAQQPQLLDSLRQSAQMAFQYSDQNKDSFVTFDEFMAFINPTPQPVPVPPYPDPYVPTGNFNTADATSSPYVTPGYPSGGYTPGYPSDPYGPSPYNPYPAISQQYAATMFNLSDRNRDRKLNASEFEDFNAWMMVSSFEPTGPAIYPTPGPVPTASAVPVTPPTTPPPTVIPSTPAVATQSIR